MNSIRPDALASLRVKGEAWKRKPTRGGQGKSGGLRCGETVSATTGMQGVVGDRMAGSWSDVNQGSRSGNSDGVHGQQSRPEEPSPEGDRASVRAKKRGNARGAKGGRVVEADQPKLGSTKRGVVPRRVGVRASMRYLPSYGGICLPLDARRRAEAVLSDDALIQRSDGRSQELNRAITWKAGCGTSACPVWEGEWRVVSSLLPHLVRRNEIERALSRITVSRSGSYFQKHRVE